MQNQKRAVAVHDISCFGKCSLTVALPIISAAGVECSVIPTAVLSTHTGGFTGFTYRDLTDDIMPIVDHWKTVGMKFDAIYTGFLGSFEQIEIVKELIKKLRSEGTLVLVDPVMADNGVMYSIFKPEFAQGMAGLCSEADIIVPNLTEAAFMLGEEYNPGPYTPEYIEGLLKRLSDRLGAKKVVLTGVSYDPDHLGAACFDAESGELATAFTDRIDGYYHGTGDVYGSALLGAVMRGAPLSKAIRIAADFTYDSISRTKAAGTDIRFGVDFEESIPDFIKELASI